MIYNIYLDLLYRTVYVVCNFFRLYYTILYKNIFNLNYFIVNIYTNTHNK